MQFTYLVRLFVYFLCPSAGLYTPKVEDFLSVFFLIQSKCLEPHLEYSRCLYKYLLNKLIHVSIICGLSC